VVRGLTGEARRGSSRQMSLNRVQQMKTGTGTASNSVFHQARIQPVAEPVPVFISPPRARPQRGMSIATPNAPGYVPDETSGSASTVFSGNWLTPSGEHCTAIVNGSAVNVTRPWATPCAAS